MRDQGMSRRAATALGTLLIAGCATSSLPVEPGTLRFRVTDVQLVGGTVQTLRISGAIDNGTEARFESGGCLRPSIEIDSATAAGWAPLGVNQSDDLVQCITAFNVSPGASQTFETSFVRSSTRLLFPLGVSLRLRAMPLRGGDGPTSPVILSP